MEQTYPLFVFLFWFGLFIVFYTYIGYGILLYLIVHIKETVKKKAIHPLPASLPDVTLFIAAYTPYRMGDRRVRRPHERTAGCL